MNARKSLRIVAAIAAFALPGVSFADLYWHPAAGERGYTEYPSHLTTTQPQTLPGRSTVERRNSISSDGLYRYTGPESGWQLIPHSYVFKGGQWVHTDNFGHDVKRPSRATSEEERRSQSNSKSGG